MVKRLILLGIILAFVFGCTTAQKGAGVGAVAGAAIGGIVGHQSGHGGEGAAIGGLAGAAGGALVGEQLDTKFCPVCGKRFTSGVEYCSADGTELKPIEK